MADAQSTNAPTADDKAKSKSPASDPTAQNKRMSAISAGHSPSPSPLPMPSGQFRFRSPPIVNDPIPPTPDCSIAEPPPPPPPAASSSNPSQLSTQLQPSQQPQELSPATLAQEHANAGMDPEVGESTGLLRSESKRAFLRQIRPKKSSLAGSRQASTESSASKALRFRDDMRLQNAKNEEKEDALPYPRAERDRRMSMAAKLAKTVAQHKGLTRIRVAGHLDYRAIRERFERQSTFHGISHAALAPTTRWRWFWYSAFSICTMCLLVQVFFLVVKYRQYAKTVDLDLKFENAPFPSVTLCNLNPYKKSQVYRNPTTKATMEAFANIVSKGDQSEGVAAALAAHLHSRVRRERQSKPRRFAKRRYHQVFAQCLCDLDPMTGERRGGGCFAAQKGKIAVEVANSPLNLHPTRCLCQLDIVSKSLWPCFPYGSWKEKLCSECVGELGHCPMRFYRGNERYEKIKDKVDICLCHKDYNHCISNNDDGVIPEIEPDEDIGMINITATTLKALRKSQEKAATMAATTTTTQAPEIVEALGFENLTDEIAIATQAQQNLMFAVGNLDIKDKISMSQDREELILKCSFNQKDCSIDTFAFCTFSQKGEFSDFKLHYDQTYGNCYTFNWNRTSAVTAHRAGANYGLRVLLYANVTEYLPTSEAVGFRITIHDKWIVPFPDAFGYNAPTGFLSSFGVRMKQFLRIEEPHGHCRHGGEDGADFIYRGFNYSVEACHRSCTQKEIIATCGCADPMYPLPNREGVKPCPVTDAEGRTCIRNTTLFLGQKIVEGNLENCVCHQPCTETNYEVTYSAARWPSGSAKVMECTSGDFLCLEKYRKNAAMIQIFYEELNYETMIESPAYTFTSAMADTGGLTGLWIGASVVSLLEFVSLIVFTAQAYVRKRKASNASSQHTNISTGVYIPPHLRSSGELGPIRKTSTKLSVQDIRLSMSTHSSRNSKMSLNADLPPPIEEQSVASSSSSSSSSVGTANQNGSCRYLAPDEELPCVCKYDSMGRIRVMKVLCPFHGYMVRRGFDYNRSDDEEDEDGEGGEGGMEVDYGPSEPYNFERLRSSRKSAKSRHRKHKSGDDTGEGPS